MKIKKIKVETIKNARMPHFVKSNPMSGYTTILMNIGIPWAVIDHNLYFIICAN